MAMTDMEQAAMERLRLASQMSLKLYKQPLLLTDSGGKDSAVICKLAENAGIPFEIVHWWMEDGVIPGQANIWEDYENALD